MEKRFEGKVAIVTGSAMGIGEAIARRLAAEGAAIVIADIEKELGTKVKEDLVAQGCRVIMTHTDVSLEDQVAEMTKAALDAFGRIDYLVNNAAATAAAHTANDKLFHDMTLAMWEKTLAHNLTSMMLCVKHVVPEIVKMGGGAVVNLSSVGGSFGSDANTAYSITKMGIVELTRSVAYQYGKQNVRCNAIMPGVTFTPALRESLPEPVHKMLNKYGACLPYWAEAEDMGSVAAFLLSDESRVITGATIPAECGVLATSSINAVGAIMADGHLF